MKHLFICLILMCSSMAMAQDVLDPSATLPTEPTPLPSEPQATVVEPAKDLPTRSVRALSQYTLNEHFSYLSTWLPVKYGISAGYIKSDNWTIEAELTRRSISAKLLSVDFGQVTDQRYGVQARWYPSSNSFNVIMGLFKSEFSFELGNTYLKHIPGKPSNTTWKFESIGPQLGLSNRFQWSNGFTLGADWFMMYIPLFNKVVDDSALESVTNASDREDLDNATKIIRNTPQFDILRLTLGYTF